MKLIYLIWLLLIIASCEKVIDIKLDSRDKKYVIEGVITDRANSCQVTITQTKNFDENNSFPGVTGAVVTIAEDSGPEITLNESSTGVYTSGLITGIPGHTYTLKVVVNKQTFTSSSTMPSKVYIDTVFIRDNIIINDKVKLANIQYHDPAGKGNYYRFIQYVNGVKDKTVFVRDDDLIDGEPVVAQLYTRNDDDDDTKDASKIKSGDIVKIEMLCIDPAVYKYWFSLDQSATGESQSASPANPVSNISGDALGYFSAHTYQNKIITAP